jgi:hypothetical protein
MLRRMKKVNQGHIGTVETRARAEVFIKLREFGGHP